jgi:hypothetical protein
MTTKIFVNYKIARVDHWRCDQPERGLSTYVWVPQAMTTEEFEALCERARDEYFKTADAAKKLLPSTPPGYSPRYEKYPDKTVAEVQAIHEAETTEWNKRNAVVNAKQRTFAQILKDISDGSVLNFWDIEFPITAEVHWGHRHGEGIAYGETKITNPSPDNFDAPEDEDDL